MPLYNYRCNKCEKTETKMNSISNHKEGPMCCDEQMGQIIEAPMVQAIILGGGSCPGYQCPITNEYVTSRKRRKEIMKENRVVEAGDGA